MLREVMAGALLLLTAVGCGDSTKSTAPAMPASGGAAGGGAADGGGTPLDLSPRETLPDLLPIAITVDCSKLGDAEPPATVYVQMSVPLNLGQEVLLGRIDVNPCAEHDVAASPDSPALAIRCPPRQLQEFDTGCYMTHHDIKVTVCSPGFESKSVELSDGWSTCPTPTEYDKPSCGSLDRFELGDYPYNSIVYETVPRADNSGYCFEQAPEALLEDQKAFKCPCAEDP